MYIIFKKKIIDENVKTNPTNKYGKTKQIAENSFKEKNKNFV